MRPKTWTFLEGRVPSATENTGAGWPNDVQGVAFIQGWWCRVNPGTLSVGGVPHSAWDGWFLTQMVWVRTYELGGLGDYTQTVQISMGKTNGDRQMIAVPYPRDADFFTGDFSTAVEDREMKDWGPLPLVTEDPVPEPPNAGLSMYDVRREIGQLFEKKAGGSQAKGLRVGSVFRDRAVLASGRGSLVLPAASQVKAGIGYFRTLLGGGRTLIRPQKKALTSPGKISYCKVAYYGVRSGVIDGYDWASEGWMQGWAQYDEEGTLMQPYPTGVGVVFLQITRVALVVIETTFADFAVSAVGDGTRAVADGFYQGIADRKNLDLLTSGETQTPIWLNSGPIETFGEGAVFENSLDLLPGDDFDTWPFASVNQTLLYESDGPFDPSSVEVLTNLSAEWI